jgi:kinesin family member C1
MESENRTLKLSCEKFQSTVDEQRSQIAALEKSEADLHAKIAEMDAKLLEEESVRRQLHNTIQELKGNIRVFCRIRPPLEKEREEGALSHINFSESDEGAIDLTQHSENASSSRTISKSYPFSFDKVFQPSAKQEVVFEEISQLVQSVLDGYNVSIFAYGQTGSGKTFTYFNLTTVWKVVRRMGPMIPIRV